MNGLTVLPVSAVPAAFDRGRLYSPTLDQTRYALDPRYIYDYRPGEEFEPMPDAPRGDAVAYARWAEVYFRAPSPDFLGLRAGDPLLLHNVVGEPSRAVVVRTCRGHAVIRYEMPAGAREPYAVTWVSQRTAGGTWY